MDHLTLSKVSSLEVTLVCSTIGAPRMFISIVSLTLENARKSTLPRRTYTKERSSGLSFVQIVGVPVPSDE
jgi:hypothetical protein